MKSLLVLRIPPYPYLTKLLCAQPTQTCAQGIGRTAGFTLRYLSAMTQPDVTYAASTPVVADIAPVLCRFHSVRTSERLRGSAPVIEYVAPTTAVTIHVPVKKTMSLRIIAKRSRCEQRKLPPFFEFLDTFPLLGLRNFKSM